MDDTSPRQPAAKRTHTSEDPAPLPDHASQIQNTVSWLLHTLGLEVLKKSVMDVNIKRNILEKLNTLSNANAQLQAYSARQEESRLNISHIIADFTNIIGEKERTITELQSKLAKLTTTTEDPDNQGLPLYSDITNKSQASVTRRGREPASSKRISAARSKSRITKRTMVLAKQREASPPPVFIFTPSDDKTTEVARTEIWKEVSKATKTPKIQTIAARNGKLILKPHNRETADVLKNIANTKGIIRKESILWPRISVDSIDSTLSPEDLSKALIEQNTDVLTNASPNDIKPVFKRGPRDRATVTWIFEVNPTLHPVLIKCNLYLGLLRCRVKKYEEVTQCHKCLRYGHPANKCFESHQFCDHCAESGHISSACPNTDKDPKCANCRGKHSARDKTCSARTSAVARILGRTTYAKELTSCNDTNMQDV